MLRALFATIILLSLSAEAWAEERDGKGITLYAAASLVDVLDAAIVRFAIEGGGKVTPVYASTANLARQIDQGAPADLFVSANAQWMDFLVDEGLVAEADRRVLASNRLVLIVPSSAQGAVATTDPPDILALIGDGVFALCETSAVPCGVYARQSLEALGAWEAVRVRSIFAEDARTTLGWVVRGEAAAGIVYRTDARSVDRVRVLYAFPEASHDPIRYEIAPVKSGDAATAIRFRDYLLSPSGRALLRDFGFAAPPTGR